MDSVTKLELRFQPCSFTGAQATDFTLGPCGFLTWKRDQRHSPCPTGLQDSVKKTHVRFSDGAREARGAAIFLPLGTPEAALTVPGRGRGTPVGQEKHHG